MPRRCEFSGSGQPLPGIFADCFEHAERWLQIVLWLACLEVSHLQRTRLLAPRWYNQAFLREREQPAQRASYLSLAARFFVRPLSVLHLQRAINGGNGIEGDAPDKYPKTAEEPLFRLREQVVAPS